MLSSVLNSPQAIRVNIAIMRTGVPRSIIVGERWAQELKRLVPARKIWS